MPVIFPYVANKTRSLEVDLEHYLSEPYSGTEVALLRGSRKRRFSCLFTTRSQTETDGAESFHADHYPLEPIIFRDYRYYPPRDFTCRFISPFREQGSETTGRFNYGFDLIEI